MSIPYERLCSSGNVPRSPYMRLPSYQSLRRQRYHPYGTTRTRSLSSSADVMEPAEDADFEADTLLACVNPISVSFSLSTIHEDDCLAGLRTVVSEMIGRDSAQMHIGSVHLVIDFAFIVRSHLRKNGTSIRDEAAMTLPPTTIALST